jgi:hypothetical protein
MTDWSQRAPSPSPKERGRPAAGPCGRPASWCESRTWIRDARLGRPHAGSPQGLLLCMLLDSSLTTSAVSCDRPDCQRASRRTRPPKRSAGRAACQRLSRPSFRVSRFLVTGVIVPEPRPRSTTQRLFFPRNSSPPHPTFAHAGGCGVPISSAPAPLAEERRRLLVATQIQPAVPNAAPFNAPSPASGPRLALRGESETEEGWHPSRIGAVGFPPCWSVPCLLS